jgi:hypothetical protein
VHLATLPPPHRLQQPLQPSLTGLGQLGSETVPFSPKRGYVQQYHAHVERAALTPERTVSMVGGVRLIVRGTDGFPMAIVFLEGGLFEADS